MDGITVTFIEVNLQEMVSKLDHAGAIEKYDSMLESAISNKVVLYKTKQTTFFECAKEIIRCF